MRTDSQPEWKTLERDWLEAVIREAIAAALASPSSKSPEPLLTKTQVAEYLNVSVRTVDLLVSEGALLPIRVRSARRFTKDGIDRYLRSTTKKR